MSDKRQKDLTAYKNDTLPTISVTLALHTLLHTQLSYYSDSEIAYIQIQQSFTSNCFFLSSVMISSGESYLLLRNKDLLTIDYFQTSVSIHAHIYTYSGFSYDVCSREVLLITK